MKDVMDRETAQIELIGIGEFFEIDFTDNESILPVVMSGRLYLDEDQKRIIYKLRKPIDLNNNGTLSEFKFKNPTGEEQARINKGIKATVSDGGGTTIDMGEMYTKTMKAVSILSGQAIGVVGRIGRGDLSDLLNLLSFL
jgi:hypothetical protein